jgi:hypothetical protein
MRTVRARLGVGPPSIIQGAGGLGIPAKDLDLQDWDDWNLLDPDDLDGSVP